MPDESTGTHVNAESRARRAITHNGIALVAVLAVLTVLAVMAAAFAAFMNIERQTGRVSVAKVQSDLLAQSALEHAKSLLRRDAEVQPAWDDCGEPWSARFRPPAKGPSKGVDVDGLPDKDAKDAKWIYVRREDGSVIGRYAVLVEDEASKINVNAAAALTPKMQNEGVGTFEMMLTDGQSVGLPISLPFGKRILRYRYGRDIHPGQHRVDDNLTASSYGSDEIDNDADGIVDETDEGIDEQEEYDPLEPRWDDRSFSSLQEALDQCSKNRRLSGSACRIFKKFGTVYTRGRDMYWDDQDNIWRRQVNLNVASKRQLGRLIRRANEETRFEPSARNLRVLIANVIDYRDENHTLTTLGSEYGVEAVCFNEIMANDGSFSEEPDHDTPYGWSSEYEFVHRYGYWYNPYDRSSFDNTSQEDRYGWRPESISGFGGKRRSFVTNGIPVNMKTVDVKLSEPSSRLQRMRFFDVFERLRKASGWPEDIWKNAYLTVQYEKNKYRVFPIAGNDRRDTLYVGVPDNPADPNNGYDQLKALVETNKTARIETFWHQAAQMWCVFPEQSDYWMIRTQVVPQVKPPPNQYYYVYIGDQNFNGNLRDNNVVGAFEDVYRSLQNYNSRPNKGFCETLDVDGNASVYSQTKMEELHEKDLKGSTLEMPRGMSSVWLLRTPYKNGLPVRARDGYVHVLLTSSRQCGCGINRTRTTAPDVFRNKNSFDVAYVMRPDIVELINISDRPISLRNWRVVINTGSYADQVGLIESALHYSLVRRSMYDDPNPAIPANGYFYLTNHRGLFDMEYGGVKDGNWGGNAKEQYGCYELPDYLWGTRYKITSIGGNGRRITLKGANWKRNQMQNEMVEFHSSKPTPSDRNGVSGIRKSVRESGRNTLTFGSIDVRYDGVRVGDDAVILGMPRAGGFLSMTLKNEYGQITARTIEYGSTEPDELNYSTEKFDPTHYTWVKTRRPTFAGYERDARNRSVKLAGYIPPHVKDNRFSSVGEIQKVRTAKDWENIGEERRGRPSTKVLKAIAKYFSVSGVRLDPEEEGVHVKGWRPAFGTVQFGSTGKLTGRGARWAPGTWKNQTLRITSGELKGEKFVIEDNTENGVKVAGYSIPNGNKLRVQKGDKFSVGPGYSTPLYYTRESGDEGVWEWKDKGLERAVYGLYLFGLNDSVDTTEFLEENHNAELEVSVFNFKTREFDRMPLLEELRGGRTLNDVYKMVGHRQRLQYDKTDGVFCGQIHPDHISPAGGIRLRLVAHNVDSLDCSGFAWFDHAYLAPGFVNGKINVNTATPRVLGALNGMTPKIARNVALGRDSSGRDRLKPYKNVSDILDVKGLTPDIFGRISNQISTRSDQYRIQVLAEALNDADNDGRFDPASGDGVLAQTKCDVVVDRQELTDDDPKTCMFRTLLTQRH